MADYSIELKYRQNSSKPIVEAVTENYHVVKPIIGTSSTTWTRVVIGSSTVNSHGIYLVYSNYGTEPHSITITNSTPPSSPNGNNTEFHVVLAGTQRVFEIDFGKDVWIKTLAGDGGTPA